MGPAPGEVNRPEYRSRKLNEIADDLDRKFREIERRYRVAALIRTHGAMDTVGEICRCRNFYQLAASHFRQGITLI